MPKISIIIPVYNSQDKLENSFKSILNQTFDFNELEIIFIDDSSSDNSVNIIKQYCEMYSNVKGIYLDKNSGFAGRPRNVGIENSTAPYLMFLDSDDVYFENACDVLYKNITENDLDIVSANYIRCVDNLTQEKHWDNIDLVDGEIEIQNISEQPELFCVSQSVWCKIFKKDFILENNIFYEEDIPAQDVHFTYNCLLNAKGIKYVNIPIVKYMPGSNDSSITSKRTKNNLLKYLKAYNLILDLFKGFPEYEISLVPHLKFWTTNLIISEIPATEKIDLLRLAFNLFDIHQKHNIKPPKFTFRKFYESVYQKDYVEAVSLCDEISIKLSDNDYKIYDEIRNRDILIVENIELYNLFKENGYSSKYISFKGQSDVKTAINVYEYYSKGPFTKNENDSDTKSQLFYNQNNFNYLSILPDYVRLHKEGYHIDFKDLNEFYEYFLSEIILQADKKPFLIGGDIIKNINSKIVYAFEYCPDYGLSEWIELFKESYLKEAKDVYDVPRKLKKENLKLTERNNRLKDKNNNLKEKLIKRNSRINELKQSKQHYIDLNKEITSSTSWKITKPLRIIKNGFKHD